MACGSVSELEYHFLLVKDLGYISPPDYDSAQKELLDLKRMLVALTLVRNEERAISKWQLAISQSQASEGIFVRVLWEKARQNDFRSC